MLRYRFDLCYKEVRTSGASLWTLGTTLLLKVMRNSGGVAGGFSVSFCMCAFIENMMKGSKVRRFDDPDFLNGRLIFLSLS